MQKRKDFIWKMGGQQGEGIESCGEIMATILAKEGYSLYSQRLFASRIKGGHTTFALRVALEQIMSIGEGVDFLLSLDQETVDMHGSEVRDGGYIICDSKVNPDFSKFEGTKINCLSLPISETAMKQGSLLMRNIVALGMSVALLGFDTKMFKDAITEKFAKKSQEIIDKNLAAFDDGHSLVMEKLGDVEIDTLPAPGKKDQMFLLGNEACALGAIAGPSTGMATKVEQSDIDAACYNAHGDYSGIVISPTSIEECFYEIQKAFNLAEMYQCPVIFMPDLQQGLNKQSVPSFDLNRVPINRGKMMKEAELPELVQPNYFKRFELTEDGISPRTIAGMKNGLFLSTGLEHNEEGKPAEAPTMHVAQTDKRFRKLETVADNYEPFLNNAKYDEADVLVVGMASSRGAIEEAVAEFDQEGVKVNHLQLRLIKPFPAKQLQPFFDAAKKVVIVEHNKTGQLANLFKINMHKKHKISSCLKYDGNPFTKSYVKNAIKEVL
ncbi:MAG: 2-oxoacid:acceptor oxidoreductase family protein [Veillonella sp.]|nr:2-oxoacid:acceptor oxidoreductase family protein [Veillonella sp.]